MKHILAFALVAALVGSTTAVCPNKCSGHGTCGSSDKCSCEPGFTNPDCSGRQCAYGLSWVPAGTSDTWSTVPMGGMGGLHAYTECSSKGTCDRLTGQCRCASGYGGKGCRRQLCPGESSECSGHGVCVYADSIDSYAPTNGDKFTSEKWDAHKTRMCECDRGWEGIDCNSKMCPKGDDPLTDCDTNNQRNQVQKITVTSKTANFAANGFIALSFTDTYNGKYTTSAIRLDANYYPQTMITNVNGDVCQDSNFPCSSDADEDLTIHPNEQYQTDYGQHFFDSDKIRSALQALPNIAVRSVNVTEKIDVTTFYDVGASADKYLYTTHSAADCGVAAGGAPSYTSCGQSIFYVTFTDDGTSGRQNLMDCHVYAESEVMGGKTTNSKECSAAHPVLPPDEYTGAVAGTFNHQITCTVEEVALAAGDSFEEHSTCSERGECDSSTGICSCYEGHSGEDCSKQTIFF